MSQDFKTVDVLRLEVETAPSGLPNLVLNPSGEKGAWFWITPVANTLMKKGTYGIWPDRVGVLIYETTVSQASNFTTDFMPVAATHWVSGRLDIFGISTGHNVKVTFDWYNASKALLSSSVQSGGLGTVGVNYIAARQAPASTAYVKARYNFYNGTANASANAAITFNQAMVTSAATNSFTTTRTNLIKNPNFEVNTASWAAGYGSLSRVTTAPYLGTGNLRMTVAAGRATATTAVAPGAVMPVSGGTTYELQAMYKHVALTSTPTFQMHVQWYTSTEAYISLSSSPTKTGSATWAAATFLATAPTNAAYAAVVLESRNQSVDADAVKLEASSTINTSYFDGSTTAAGHTYSWTGTAHNSASTDVAADFAYSEPHTWQNILGPSHAIHVDRKALDIGLLSATVLDALLDPAVSSDIRPGRLVRLRATTDAGATFASIYEGRIDNARVAYTRDKTDQVTNLVTNPGFETDITGWTAESNCSIARSTAQASSGIASMAVTITAAGSGGAITSTGTSGVPVTAGATYTATAKFRAATTGRTCTTYINWYDGAGAFISNTSGSVVDTTTGFSLASVTATAPATAAYASVATWAAGAAAGEVHYVDAVTLLHPTKVNTRIELTASDNIAVLANQGEARGVATIAALPFLLEGKGVPWNVNGSGNQIASASQVAKNENASVLDQVAVTRDSVSGYAWVTRANVLSAYDAASMPSALMATFSDVSGVSYSDIDAGFNTDACINEVLVTWLRYNAVTGETTEIPYGPYRDQASIDTYGAHSKTFVIQGATESAATISAFASAVLAANKTPVRRASRVTVPIKNAAGIVVAAALDLYDLAHVDFSTIINANYRITGLTHDISPDLWQMVAEFEAEGSVASPQVTPSPTGAGRTDVTYPVRRVVSATRTTSTTNATTPYNIATATIPYPIDGQRYRVTATANLIGDTAGAATFVQVKHGINASTGGTQVGEGQIDFRAASRTETCTLVCEFTYAGTSGQSVFNVVLVAAPNVNGSLCTASATRPSTVTVDEIS